MTSRLETLARAGVIAARTGLAAARLALRCLLAAGGGRRRRAVALGEELARLCEGLGPTYVKLGQVLSARPDLLSREVAGPLRRLQDCLAPVASGRVAALVEEAFGRPLPAIFARFDRTPVASASVAQVHRARLLDGREVAVKIRRPDAVSRMRRDLALLAAAARGLGRLPALRTVPLPELVAELAGPLLAQLDFNAEAANLRRFRRHFHRVEHITLPRPVDEWCCESVLTMEFIERLERVTAPRFSAEERRTAALAGLRALYKMIFLDGFVHADLHPGNVFLRAFGELVILDMGLVAELADHDRRDFVDFFFGLVQNQGQVCARIVYDTAVYRSPRCDRAAFEAAMVRLVGRHSALTSHQFEVTRFVYELLEAQRRFGIRGSTRFIMTVLAMVVYDGICKQLYPECDFQREARGYLITARYGRPPPAAAAV